MVPPRYGIGFVDDREVPAPRRHAKKSDCPACRAAGTASEHCPKCAVAEATAGRRLRAVEVVVPEPDKDEPALREGRDVRPLEAGWWTSRTPTSNTIGCDGSGGLSVMQNGATYKHGVTDCTIQHEQIHVSDWLARYGKNICKGRAKGDLPYYDPPGKQAYRPFLEKSECSAWTVGEACRKGKLAACKSDDCRKYVQRHVDFAAKMVKKYCGP